MNNRELFLKHIAQTSPAPLALEITRASGSWLYDSKGRKYLDLISGISVCNIGHRHPQVEKAIRKQSRKYLHLLVYGELIETPQVKYAEWLAEHLPVNLDTVYFTNSGAEATEGAMKLAKRATGRTEIIAFNKSYHGSTQGALSILGDEYWRNAYRPLLPGVWHMEYNDKAVFDRISDRTACVIAETVQAERGVVKPDAAWLQALAARCREKGALLILDEIQTGFGRTGTLWGFAQYGVVPDMVLLGKALGGGLPLGAFVANQHLMRYLTENPVLGHITTFGGHPLSCAAGLAAARVLVEEDLPARAVRSSDALQQRLQHPLIRQLRAAGLLMAIDLGNAELASRVIGRCLKKRLLTDWFLFAPECIRIAPPLNISDKEVDRASQILLEAMHREQSA